MFKTLLFACFVAGALADLAVPTLTEAQRNEYKLKVQEYCDKNGAGDKTDEVVNSIHGFVDCMKGLFNTETIKNEIEEAKPHGALDEVFKKYCEKSPQLKTCLKTLADGVSPCLPKDFANQKSAVDKSTDKLIDFVCYKDGDRIAMFIAENGPECIQSKVAELQECGNKMKSSISSLDDFYKMTRDEKCNKFDELSKCLVDALEKCSSPTPGNMAEAMLKYVRKDTQCNDKKN